MMRSKVFSEDLFAMCKHDLLTRLGLPESPPNDSLGVDEYFRECSKSGSDGE